LTALGDYNISLTENSTARRVLDNVYDQVVAECLKRGSWNFAMESVKLVADTGVEPNFGDSEIFAKPTDFVRLFALSADENFDHPLLQYVLEQDYIAAPVTPIYMRYVSDDTGMGLELSRWTPDFRRYVELELAARVCFRLTQDKTLADRVDKLRDKARKEALSNDAMDEASAKFKPEGFWNAARRGRNRGDRGRTDKLIG